MPNGKVPYLAKDKESADYMVTRKYYVFKSNAKKRVSVINVEVSDSDLEEYSNFKNYCLIHYYSVEPKGDPMEVPDVTKNCIRTVKPVKAQEKTLKQFSFTGPLGFQLITKNDKGKYYRVKTDVESGDAVAGLQVDEYNHTIDNNIKAIHMQVTAFSGAKELEKLENLGFLQVFSKEKQVLIHIDKILAKMKTWEESDCGDFLVRTLKDIEKDKELKDKTRKGTDIKIKHQKVDGEFKRFKDMKSRGEVPTSLDLVCQKYHFESTEVEDLKYYVLHIIQTADKELKPFIGKCLVQKEDGKHQSFTKPDAVLKFMLANCDFVE